MRITNEEFIRIWQASSCLAAVSLQTKLSTRSASIKASNLRSKGVRLKTFRRGRPKTNYKKLRKLVEASK